MFPIYSFIAVQLFLLFSLLYSWHAHERTKENFKALVTSHNQLSDKFSEIYKSYSLAKRDLLDTKYELSQFQIKEARHAFMAQEESKPQSP